MKIYTRGIMLAAIQLPLAGFIAETANAESPQQMEQLEAIVHAQAAQLEKLNAEMQALKKAQSKTSQEAHTAPQRPQTASQQAQPASQLPKNAPKKPYVGAPVAYPVEYTSAYSSVPPDAKTPGAIGSPQYPNYVSAGTKPLSWMLPGSDISMQIGGYAKLDAIGIVGGARSNGAADQFNVFGIQARGNPSPAAPGDPSANIHARQSRFYLEADKADTPVGPVRAYFEGDFFGPIDLGTPTASNSHTFRLRHAFAEVGPLLAGQTWSTYIDPTTYAELLDFTGPGGESFLRQGQVRFTQNLGGGFEGAVAVENPGSRVRVGAGTALAPAPISGDGGTSASGITNVDGVFGRESFPDLIGRIRYASPEFNLMISAVMTRNTAPPLGTVPGVITFPGNGNLGYGTQLSGQIAVPWFNKKDNFRFMTGYLDGASRYMLDGGVIAPSVAYDATGTQFQSIKIYGGFGALQHWWTDNLRSNLVLSYVHNTTPVFSGPAAIAGTRYGAVNLIWSPWVDVDIGTEFQYGQVVDADGAKAFQTRVQSSLIYRF